MKKLKLNSSKLLLKKQKVAGLTNDQMSKVMGGEPYTGVTVKNCCLPCTYNAPFEMPGSCPIELTTAYTCPEGCGYTLSSGDWTCVCTQVQCEQ